MKLNIFFRVDSSQLIGAGHVMRCLTLADAFLEKKIKSKFICKELEGNLIQYIELRGYEVFSFPNYSFTESIEEIKIIDLQKKEIDSELDAIETIKILSIIEKIDWLIVDHYSLDSKWELKMREYAEKVMVIDDAVNRSHFCEILLDQTIGRIKSEYQTILNKKCKYLLGKEFVLISPSYIPWREYSLSRRKKPKLNQILISLGGADKDNISSKILLALSECNLPSEIEITLILGMSSPWINEMKKFVEKFSMKIELKVAVNNMPELLAKCDLAIGAAGTSAWERCYLGVPSLMFVIADNQTEIANKLSKLGAAKILGLDKNLRKAVKNSIQEFIDFPEKMNLMSLNAASLISSSGAANIVKEVINFQS